MIYMFIAEGFEEIEALCPLDLMRRAGIEVTTVGIGRKEIVGAHGITVRTDICSREYSKVKDFDMIFRDVAAIVADAMDLEISVWAGLAEPPKVPEGLFKN